MKVVSKYIDPRCKCGNMKLIPNNNDDIYYLSSVIKPGDKVFGFTTRKISADGGKTQQKKTMWLEVKVVSTESDLEAGIIYVKGKTCRENEFVRIGSHHTLDISVGNEFEIYKNLWENSELATIKECCEDVLELCFVVFFEKDCVVSTVSANTTKTVYKEEIKNKNLKGVVSSVAKLKPSVKNIVIASSTDIRTELHKALVRQDPSIEKMTVLTKLDSGHRGQPNSKVISNILADKAVLHGLQNLKFVDDLKEVQKFFHSVDVKHEEVCIGLKEVAEAMDCGAIKVLFVTDKFCKPKTVSEREFADGFIERARRAKARVCVIPAGLDLGERLEAFGQVACSLSFNFK